MTPSWITVIVLPLVLSWAIIAALRNVRWTRRLEDRPNERSLHTDPRRRVGGIGLVLGALPVAAWSNPVLDAFLACAAALAVVSFLDDFRSLPIQVRLPAHIAAAAVAVLAMGSPHLGVLYALLAVLFIAWMTNLFNFMDGADGLAGGMAAIGFGALAAGAALQGAVPLAIACTAFASASVGFLLHNFPPARVFMGDAGSIPVGFLAGCFATYGVATDVWPAWFPLLVFSPFIVDASFTLVMRGLRREPVWRAHRSHLYQRLVLAGWSHRRLAIAAYALMVAVALSALAAAGSDPMVQCGTIAVWVVAYLLLLLASGRFLPQAGQQEERIGAMASQHNPPEPR
jgi:UDP-N-acetylmuramyl pentapeptide phosphotransferase/UDP-N-acetylglucosamine-1-phosphate transferase